MCVCRVAKLKQLLARSKQSQARKEEDINMTIQAHVDATEDMKAQLQQQFDRDRRDLESESRKKHIESSFTLDSELLVQATAERLHATRQQEHLADIEALREKLRLEQDAHAALKARIDEASSAESVQRDMITVFQTQLEEKEAQRREALDRAEGLLRAHQRQATELKNMALVRSELEYEIKVLTEGKFTQGVDMEEYDRCVGENKRLAAQLVGVRAELSSLSSKHETLVAEEANISHRYSLQSIDHLKLNTRMLAQSDEVAALKKFIFDNRIRVRKAIQKPSDDSGGEVGASAAGGLQSRSSENLLGTLGDSLTSALATPTVQLPVSEVARIAAGARELAAGAGRLLEMDVQLGSLFRGGVAGAVRQLQAERGSAQLALDRLVVATEARRCDPARQHRERLVAIIAHFVHWFKAHVLMEAGTASDGNISEFAVVTTRAAGALGADMLLSAAGAGGRLGRCYVQNVAEFQALTARLESLRAGQRATEEAKAGQRAVEEAEAEAEAEVGLQLKSENSGSDVAAGQDLRVPLVFPVHHSCPPSPRDTYSIEWYVYGSLDASFVSVSVVGGGPGGETETPLEGSTDFDEARAPTKGALNLLLYNLGSDATELAAAHRGSRYAAMLRIRNVAMWSSMTVAYRVVVTLLPALEHTDSRRSDRLVSVSCDGYESPVATPERPAGADISRDGLSAVRCNLASDNSIRELEQRRVELKRERDELLELADTGVGLYQQSAALLGAEALLVQESCEDGKELQLSMTQQEECPVLSEFSVRLDAARVELARVVTGAQELGDLAAATTAGGGTPLVIAAAPEPLVGGYHTSAYAAGAVGARGLSRPKIRAKPKVVSPSANLPVLMEAAGQTGGEGPLPLSASRECRMFHCASGRASAGAMAETSVMLQLPCTNHRAFLVWRFSVAQNGDAAPSQDIGFTVLHKPADSLSYSEIVPYVRHYDSDFHRGTGVTAAVQPDLLLCGTIDSGPVPLSTVGQVERDTLVNVHGVQHIPALGRRGAASAPVEGAGRYCCVALPTAATSCPSSALVVFDNKYSWVRRKELEYCFMVLVQEPPGQNTLAQKLSVSVPSHVPSASAGEAEIDLDQAQVHSPVRTVEESVAAEDTLCTAQSMLDLAPDEQVGALVDNILGFMAAVNKC